MNERRVTGFIPCPPVCRVSRCQGGCSAPLPGPDDERAPATTQRSAGVPARRVRTARAAACGARPPVAPRPPAGGSRRRRRPSGPGRGGDRAVGAGHRAGAVPVGRRGVLDPVGRGVGVEPQLGKALVHGAGDLTGLGPGLGQHVGQVEHPARRRSGPRPAPGRPPRWPRPRRRCARWATSRRPPGGPRRRASRPRPGRRTGPGSAAGRGERRRHRSASRGEVHRQVLAATAGGCLRGGGCRTRTIERSLEELSEHPPVGGHPGDSSTPTTDAAPTVRTAGDRSAQIIAAGCCSVRPPACRRWCSTPASSPAARRGALHRRGCRPAADAGGRPPGGGCGAVASLPQLAVLGVVGAALIQWFYFVAIDRLPVGIAILLEFTGRCWWRCMRRVVQREQVQPACGWRWRCRWSGSPWWPRCGGHPARRVGVAAGTGAAACLATFLLLGRHSSRRPRAAGLRLLDVRLASLFWVPLEPLASRRGRSWPRHHARRATRRDGRARVGGARRRDRARDAGALPARPGGAAPPVGHDGRCVGMLEPVVATVVAWAWLDQSLAAQVLGGVVVLAGVGAWRTGRRPGGSAARPGAGSLPWAAFPGRRERAARRLP